MKAIYKLYEIKLLKEVKKFPPPKHVAFIMDGNRRYAKKKGLPSYMGHFFGSRKAEEVLKWCLELKIKTVTAYAFSTENFRRSEEEKINLFKLMERELRRLMEDRRIHKNKVRVRIVGKRELLPENVQKVVDDLERATRDYDRYNLNIALAYGGRQELVDAIRCVLRLVEGGKIRPEEIDRHLIERFLYSDNGYESVDILIRTGGEQRLSNFLPWQTTNCLAYFSDVFWPEFRKIDFLRAIRMWQRRVFAKSF
ncbi:polyprenyl diphosphate synthase [Archaeoglobus profundus]|uniref:Tritrans,polycis-undecaprenyl-diphosphate synthase (geranylgeranyl-diphosphate specific) n=1 Tax=Archaeoglobus profundus (strain DSM 5631 / JCM 9629 / NBRC 100127 / Av18) TaxID=572546 RepID=D2RGY2_ARCPA|nr:polyprenyl diphosphate synthase [Archaeoglobus profundus]ADB57557.1 undecaprenyl diphosphate synthase [Archaeoglobus profundus DSM 5631]